MVSTVIIPIDDLQVWQMQAIDEGIEAANQGRLFGHDDLRSRWE